MHADQFWTTSLREAPWGAAVTRILAAAVAAVEPAAAVHRFLRRDGTYLHAGDQTYDLARYQRVFVVGAGKAGAPMARATQDVLGDRLTGGVVVVKEGYATTTNNQSEAKEQPTSADQNGVNAELNQQFSPINVIEAGHPVPDERCVAGARHVIELLDQATERDLVIALISGGGSALLTLPVDGVTLTDLQALTKVLLRCGASINEINTLRKHLDQVKGGGLARTAHPATLVALILSDVVGIPLDIIASGPTVADPSTFADAFAVLEGHGVLDEVSPSIREHLRRGRAGEVPETLKPGDPRLADVTTLLVGSNSQAAEAALATARAEGFHTLLLTTFLQGEAREVGRVLAAVGRELASSARPLERPACIVAGGETTVTLRGAGLGGRNQELALAAVADLAGLHDLALVTLATDGGDGPTDAAGAVVTGTTLARAHRLQLDPADYLAHNDAYPFFTTLGDLLQPGPTNTNVNDLAFVFAF